MNTSVHSDQWKLSATAAAVTAMAVCLTGCGRHGDDVLMTMAGENAGNSPFIGVVMTATCANTVVGGGLFGTMDAPGNGYLTFGAPCAAPLRIEATGAGKMRPIGAKADGSEDLPYDPAFNLPISVYLDAIPAPGSVFTANPVTSLVANLVKQHGVSFADAKSKVENALGMNAGDADKDYSDPDVAQASSRMAAIAALVAQYAANSSSKVDLGGKTVGQWVEDTWAQAILKGVIDGTPKPLSTASGLANALKSKVDVTSDPSVTGAELEIDSEANRVYNLVASVQGLDGQLTSTSDIPVGVKNVSNAISAMSGCVVDSHAAAVRKTAEKYKFAKKVSDINASTSTTKRIDIEYADTVRKAAESPLDQKISLCGGTAPLVLVSTTTSATTSTTGSGTTTTGSDTTTTGSDTTTTTAAQTTTTIATTTTTSSTTTTTLIQGTSINLAGGPTTINAQRWVGTDLGGNFGVNYAGDTILFGPYSISGLVRPASVTMIGIFAVAPGYQTISKNGGARMTEQTLNNGDNIMLAIELAKYSNNNITPLEYAHAYTPQIMIGRTVITFGSSVPGTPGGIVTCANPANPISGYPPCL